MNESTGRETRVALITGANKGIGYEIARGLCKQDFEVLIGCRDHDRGAAAVANLAEQGCKTTSIVLDVTQDDSILRAVEEITAKYGRLDVLVNNAGIFLEEDTKPSVIKLNLVKQTYETNVFGPMAMIQALLPLLSKSNAGRIVNVSTSVGSLTLASDPDSPWSQFAMLGYSTSKTALNGVTVQFANELRKTKIKINSVCPGYVATDLNGHAGHRTPEQGAAIAIKFATLSDDGPTGRFFDEEGPVVW